MFKSKSFFVRLLSTYIILVLVVVFAMLFLPAINTTVGQVFYVIFVFAIGGALSVLATKFNHNLMIKPMKEIIEMTNKIAKGEFGARARVYYTDEEINRLAYNFNKMASEFENLEQMRKSFVANASHELKSPLTSIQGFLHAIIDGTIAPDETQKYLEIIYNESKRLSSMINSMLDLSRIDSGKFPINKGRMEINELIRRIVIRFEQHMLKKNITLGVDFIEEYCYVYADKERIEQVLVNLIDNAIKYSPNNTKIQITTHIHLNKVYISVKDEGAGMSKKDQLLIWERFYTVDKARTPGKSKGTGLGLSIVKKIIDEHKEIIWVEGAPGQGSTFIFTLTLYNPNLHGSSAAQPPKPGGTATTVKR